MKSILKYLIITNTKYIHNLIYFMELIRLQNLYLKRKYKNLNQITLYINHHVYHLDIEINIDIITLILLLVLVILINVEKLYQNI